MDATNETTTTEQTAVYLSLKPVAWKIINEYHAEFAEVNPPDYMGMHYGVSVYVEPTRVDPAPYVARLRAVADRYGVDLQKWIDWMNGRYMARNRNFIFDEEVDLVFNLVTALEINGQPEA